MEKSVDQQVRPVHGLILFADQAQLDHWQRTNAPGLFLSKCSYNPAPRTWTDVHGSKQVLALLEVYDVRRLRGMTFDIITIFHDVRIDTVQRTEAWSEAQPLRRPPNA
jgi:hypothetical protein